MEKKINLDDLMKEIKEGNSFIFKAEEIKLIKLKNKLEKKEGKIEKIETRKRKSSLSPSTKMAIPVCVSWFSLMTIGILIGGLLGIFMGVLIGILSAVAIIFFDYVNPRLLKKDCSNLKLEIHEIEGRIEENIRETKQEKLMSLIREGNIELNRGNAIDAHQIYQNARKILTSAQKKYEIDKNISNLLYSKIKLTQENLNQNSIKKIKVIIKKSNEQEEQGKLRNSLQEAQKALKVANEMFTSDGKKSREIQMIKTKIDEIYTMQIKKLIESGNQLKAKKSFNNIIEIFNRALDISDKMNSSNQKDQVKDIIENNLDLIYFDVINEIIESGNQLKKQIKFDDSIQKYQNASDIAKKINNSYKKNNEIRKINILINQSKIAKIKNTILNLGVKFDRLHIAEIVEKCSESEGDIIDTALEMIKNKEIYAEYFKSTQSVVFDKQANIDEIDKLMEVYKEWEEKEVGKK